MNVELRHLRYFVAVADELHFGRAAEILHIAQPALSQQIQRLESLLDTQLFVRTSRSVALTPAGSVFRDRAKMLLRQSQRDFDEVMRIGRGEQGRLDVGFVSSALPLGPIERVQQFRSRYPGVQVKIHEGFTSQLIAQILSGEIDIATVRDPVEQPGLTMTALVTELFVGVVPAQHPLAARATITGAELATEPFVFFPRAAGELAHQLNLQPVLGAGRQPQIVQEASNWATIMHLIGSGLGVSIAPASATSLAPSTVRIIPLAGTDARTTLYLASRTNDTRPTVLNFLQLPIEI